MSSAFVELLQKSNLDYLLTRKPFKVGSRSDDILFVSLINTKAKQLQLVACLDKADSATIWSTLLDERAFQLNARLLDITELGETMKFLAGRISESDFTLAKGISTDSNNRQELSQMNVTFVYPKNKQSITLPLEELADDGEKALLLSKILWQVSKQNEQLSTELKSQQLRIKELSTKSHHGHQNDHSLLDTNLTKGNLAKPQERSKMSLINPSTKRRRAATGINYDDDDSD